MLAVSRSTAIEPEVLQAKALKVTRLLKALANPARLMVLCQLAEGEKAVSELEAAVSLSQSALSQHLAVLRRERLVATRRAGQNVIYILESPEAAAMMQALYEVFCGAGAARDSVNRLGQRRREAA